MACEDSASIDCARVMRGIASIAKLVTPAVRERPDGVGRVSGARKPTSTEPSASRPISSALGGATFATTSPEKPSPERRAGLRVGRVRVVGALARAGLDGDLEAVAGQALDHLGHQGHPALALGRFLGY